MAKLTPAAPSEASIPVWHWPFLVWIHLAGWILARLPRPMVSAACQALGWLTWKFSDRRQVVLSNLHHAFPEWPEEDRESLARENLTLMFEMFLLTYAARHLSERRWAEVLTVDEATREQVREAARERGLVVWVPHVVLVGAMIRFPVLFPSFSTQGCLYRPQDFPPMETYIRSGNQRFGLQMLSRKDGLLQARRILEARGLLGVIFDQNAQQAGALSFFMGRVASTSDLAATLSQKYRCPSLLLIPKRTGLWRGRLEAYPLASHGTSVAIQTATANEALADWLRANRSHAAQWFWAHQRWKIRHRPKHRLSLDFRKSHLPETVGLQPGGRWPRTTRLAFLLPEDPAEVEAFLPLLPEIRQHRPDAFLVLLTPHAHLDRLRDADVDRVVPFGPLQRARRAAFQKLRKDYLDTIFVLEPAPEADRLARLTRCPAIWSWQRPGDSRGRAANVLWRPAPEDVSPPAHRWRRLLEFYGLPTPGLERCQSPMDPAQDAS